MSPEFNCLECVIKEPHDHGFAHVVGGGVGVPAIIYRSTRDPNAELRDPETGEVIFRAKRAPFKLIEGDKP